MPLKDSIARSKYKMEWERKKYALVKRVRVYTPEQKARRRELERLRGPGKWDKSPAAKVHKREYARKWRAKYPEKMRVANKIAYNNNLARDSRYYCKLSRRHRSKDPQKIRDNAKRSYDKNPTPHRKRSAEWRKANPVKVLIFSQARRARKMNATTENCSAKIAILKLAPFCHWCCCAVTPKTVHIDHVVPLARGGKHCNDNLVASCQPCNNSRGAKLISEWTWKEAA